MPRRKTVDPEEHQEELRRKLSFCIHSYRHASSSTPISTRSLQRIRRELAEGNPKLQEFKEDKEDYLNHKLSIQHQMQQLEERVKRERYNAFSARYESELRNRRLLFQTQERMNEMKRPWTATGSPSHSPTKSTSSKEVTFAEGAASAEREKEREKINDERALDANQNKSKPSSPKVSPLRESKARASREKGKEVVGGGKRSSGAKGNVEVALEITQIPTGGSKESTPAEKAKEKRKSLMKAKHPQDKRKSLVKSAGEKGSNARSGRSSFMKSASSRHFEEEVHRGNLNERKNMSFASRRGLREVQGTVTLPHRKEAAPRVRKVNSARTNYRHPITGQLLQRPSSQPTGGLLNSKTVDMNFAFWGFRKTRSAGKRQAPRVVVSSKEAMTGKLHLGSGWRPCPPAMFDVSNISPVHGKIRAWQDEEFARTSQ